jgi:cysteine desulfurase
MTRRDGPPAAAPTVARVEPVYADYNATTPCLPAVVAAMAAALARPGNPSARQHGAGRAAAAAVDAARQDVAALINARPEELLFTSGATESCNLAIIGAAEPLLARRPRFITVASEHPAVLAPHRKLAEAGAEVIVLPVGRDGRLDPAALAAALGPATDERTALVSVMLVNNETGVIHDLPAIAEAAHARGALVFCDAAQAPGRLAVDVAALGVDLLGVSAHKLYGPTGVGALWLRRGLTLAAQLHGGGQERGLRAGSLNVAGIVGFGVAARLARAEAGARPWHLTALTARLESGLRAALPDLVIQGAAAPRAPGTTMATLPGLPRGWLANCPGIAAANGSSCASGANQPSHVLLAMGVDKADAGNSLRLGLGLPTTQEEVDRIVAEVAAGAARLRRTA